LGGNDILAALLLKEQLNYCTVYVRSSTIFGTTEAKEKSCFHAQSGICRSTKRQNYVWDGTIADLCRGQTHTDVLKIQAERARAQSRNVAVALRKLATT